MLLVVVSILEAAHSPHPGMCGQADLGRILILTLYSLVTVGSLINLHEKQFPYLKYKAFLLCTNVSPMKLWTYLIDIVFKSIR